MNILKYTNRFIKSGFVGITCLACFSSCNYLDVIPPAQPDMEDTMTDKSATLGFLFSCYAPILEFHTYNINYLENGSDETPKVNTPKNSTQVRSVILLVQKGDIKKKTV